VLAARPLTVYPVQMPLKRPRAPSIAGSSKNLDVARARKAAIFKRTAKRSRTSASASASDVKKEGPEFDEVDECIVCGSKPTDEGTLISNIRCVSMFCECV
jgi:hypothetical protein